MAEGVVFLELVGFGDLVEVHDAVDVGDELALGDELVDGLASIALGGGGAGGGHEAVDGLVAGVERADGEGRGGFASGHEDEAAAAGEEGDSGFEVWFAEGFVPDVDAVGGFGGEDVGGVLLFVFDDEIGAEIAGEFGLVGGAGGGDDAGAGGFGDLDDHGADAACAAVDEDGFAGLEVSLVVEAHVGGDAGDAEGGGGGVIDIVGGGLEAVGLDEDKFGGGAEAGAEGHGAPDAIA